MVFLIFYKFLQAVTAPRFIMRLYLFYFILQPALVV